MDPDRSDQPGPAVPTARLGPRAWLGHRDPGLRATARSLRAAVLVPAVFAIAQYGTSNGQTPLFAVFGAVAILLFANFGGPPTVRARAYLGLWVIGALFLTVGTLCSTQPVVAVVSMGAVGFVVLFAGVVSPQAVAGSTAALLTFVLPVAGVAGPSAIPDRLLGWALAGAVCIPAALVLGTARWHDPLRQALATAARAIADLLTAPPGTSRALSDRASVDRVLAALRSQYEATPYRPTGAGPTDVALTNLVPRLEWAGTCAERSTSGTPRPDEAPRGDAIAGSAADVLYTVADLMTARDPTALSAASSSLTVAVEKLTAARREATDAALVSMLGSTDSGVGPDGSSGAAVPGPFEDLSDIDPTYPTRMLAFALEMLAEVALDALGSREHDGSRIDRWRASARSWIRVAAGHLTPGSVWFRNAVRGAVALALAVLVVEVTTVQHGFWVVLGTLSVLRSNAVGTGSTALRAIVGTVAGFVIGAAVLQALGPHVVLLWLVLPVAVLIAAIAPTTISFTVGQAGFTVFVFVIFNIVDPVGYSVGLVRVEDVAIGVGVSVVVGLLFWPRGAAAELARTLGEAFTAATAWLVAAVDRVGRESDGSGGAPWSPERIAAIDASQRLDDAYRQYVAERGAKQIPQPVVTRLLTGCARIRLTAVTLEGLPELRGPGGAAPLPEVQFARDVVTRECEAVEQWFAGFAASLGTRTGKAVPPAAPVDVHLASELVEAWEAVRRDGRRDGAIAVLRLLWIEERMDDLRALQADLASSATALGH